MHSQRTILDLIDHIYAAVKNNALWPMFLEKLATPFRATATNLFVQDLRHLGDTASATFGNAPYLAESGGRVCSYGNYRREKLCIDDDSEFVARAALQRPALELANSQQPTQQT